MLTVTCAVPAPSTTAGTTERRPGARRLMARRRLPVLLGHRGSGTRPSRPAGPSRTRAGSQREWRGGEPLVSGRDVQPAVPAAGSHPVGPSPPWVRAASRRSADSPGSADRSRDRAPATCGAATEVPVESTVPYRSAVRMPTPGAAAGEPPPRQADGRAAGRVDHAWVSVPPTANARVVGWSMVPARAVVPGREPAGSWRRRLAGRAEVSRQPPWTSTRSCRPRSARRVAGLRSGRAATGRWGSRWNWPRPGR